jgi:glycosyltransferase involved in cell wall biosynthesis
VALRPDPSSPRASVVVPAYHSDATIGRLLEGLRAQTFRDFELIVVNSSQEGRTERIVREHQLGARFEQSPRRLLPHAARNRGVEAARGSLLAFTDPDCVPEEHWLERLVAASDRGHGVIVGAMALLDTSAYARTVHLCKFAHWLPGTGEGHRAIAPTANALYTREAWDAIGPFRADSFSSDTLHSWNAARLGFRPWFEPAAIVSHHHDGTMRSFLHERHVRGEDFARIRAAEGGHSRGWAAARLIALPAVPVVELARVGISAGRAGWGRPFATTAPLQLAANTAWALGEARAYTRLLRGGPAAR